MQMVPLSPLACTPPCPAVSGSKDPSGGRPATYLSHAGCVWVKCLSHAIHMSVACGSCAVHMWSNAGRVLFMELSHVGDMYVT